MKKIWRTENPKREGDFICRMMNAYIKMCHWTGTEWLDMWKPTLDGVVIEWMVIPYEETYRSVEPPIFTEERDILDTIIPKLK